MDDLSKLDLAYLKIDQYHGNQLRKDGSKFNNHLFDVFDILKTHGVDNIDVLIASLLHDIIEDTKYSKEDLLKDFGNDIYNYVLECTDNKTLPKFERKLLQVAKINFLKHESRLIKIADKISNLKSILNSPPTNWSKERIFGYIAWTNKFINNIVIRNNLENDLIKTYLQLYNSVISYYSYNFNLEENIYNGYIYFLKYDIK